MRSSSGGSDVFERKQRRQLTQPLLLSDEEEEEAVDDTGNTLSQGSIKFKLCKVRFLITPFYFCDATDDDRSNPYWDLQSTKISNTFSEDSANDAGSNQSTKIPTPNQPSTKTEIVKINSCSDIQSSKIDSPSDFRLPEIQSPKIDSPSDFQR